MPKLRVVFHTDPTCDVRLPAQYMHNREYIAVGGITVLRLDWQGSKTALHRGYVGWRKAIVTEDAIVMSKILAEAFGITEGRALLSISWFAFIPRPCMRQPLYLVRCSHPSLSSLHPFRLHTRTCKGTHTIAWAMYCHATPHSNALLSHEPL